jgi:hypothetical protein
MHSTAKIGLYWPMLTPLRRNRNNTAAKKERAARNQGAEARRPGFRFAPSVDARKE